MCRLRTASDGPIIARNIDHFSRCLDAVPARPTGSATLNGWGATHEVVEEDGLRLRVLFTLVERRGQGPVSMTELAKTNDVPKRFLEHIMLDLKKNATRKIVISKATGRVAYDEFNPGMSFELMHAIDRVLARHYGFTDEELDFIINYDIKYRMGQASGDEEEE